MTKSKNHYPEVRFQKGHVRRFRAGHPWAFSNEIQMTPEVKQLPKGTLVNIVDAGDERLGVGSFNPHSLIALRVLSRDPDAVIDAAFFAQRFEAAKSLRDTLYGKPFYRLIHSEADGLPGLIVDRYGDVFSVQVNTAGMERLTPIFLDALTQVFAPKAVVLRNDSPVRTLEGLALEHKVALGELSGPVELEENGCRFVADLTTGQKTGWFYDQRENRAYIASFAKGKRVLDMYTYAGGFAMAAAKAGATEVLAVDRSEGSLALVAQSAALNNLPVKPVRAEAYAEMERLYNAGDRFGVVICDPPAFVKNKKDLGAGAKGYRKMAKLAAPLVEPGGFLLCASCSHHMPLDRFLEEIAGGIAQAGRTGRILRISGAGADHPLHPMLPESAYLKAVVYQLD